MIYNEKNAKITRIMYIIEAALQYFISIGVGSTYLPKIGAMLGFSESGQIILTSCVSLGTAFNFFSIFLAKFKPVKPWLVPLHILNQIFFSLVWFVPTIRINNTAKAILFVTFYLTGELLINTGSAPTWTWFNSMVDMDKRGRFTATKEIVSLVGGMVFTLLFSRVYDGLGEGNDITYIVCGIIMFALTVLHTFTLIFTTEKPVVKTEEKVKTKFNIKEMLTNKSLIKLLALEITWKTVMHVTIAFFAVFQYNVMHIQVATVGAIAALVSLIRAIVSRPIGKIADKKSFPVLLNVCFTVEIGAMLAIVLYIPLLDDTLGYIDGIGLIFPVLMCFAYKLCYELGLIGLTGGFNNLLYDYIGEDGRTQAIAIKNTVIGLFSFLCTLVFTKIKEGYDLHPIVIGDMTVHFIQLAAAISILIIIGLIVYNKQVIMKMKKEY